MNRTLKRLVSSTLVALSFLAPHVVGSIEFALIISSITPTRTYANSKAPNFITIGSSKEEVFAVQGTPREVQKYHDVEVWYYNDYSRVQFRNGKLDEWRNNGSLKVSLAPSEARNNLLKEELQQPVSKPEQIKPFYQDKNIGGTNEQVAFAHKKQKGFSPSISSAENGSYYGQISPRTGRPKTTHVRGYHRKDGTYVRGHYRSKR